MRVVKSLCVVAFVLFAIWGCGQIIAPDPAPEKDPFVIEDEEKVREADEMERAQNDEAYNGQDEADQLEEEGVHAASEADNFIGEYAKFVGTVSEVSQPGASGDPIFVNIGGAYPNASLTGVCWSEYHSNFDLWQYEGKTVVIEGTVYDYEGTPNIELTDSFQIREME